MARRNKSRPGLFVLGDVARIEILEGRVLLAAPDLTAAIVSLDTIVARGHQINVDFRVTNAGTAPTAQTWTDRIWLSPTATFDSKTANDIGIWWNGDNGIVGTLPLAPAPGPGNSYESNRSATIPTTLATGTYYVFVEADRWNEIAESDETNNFSAAAAVTVIAPDIAMTQASITNPPSPYNVTWGQKIDVSFTVTNKTAARLDGYWFDTVVASKDPVLDASDWALSYVAYEPMAPHGSYTHSTQVSVDGPWALNAGVGYLLFVANNVDWSSPDADRSDNVIAIPIIVHAPDLQVTSSGLDDKGTPITPASLVPAGTKVNVSWTGTNTGDAAAVAPWADSVYVSKKSTFDSAANWFGFVDPPAGTFPLGAGNNYTNNFSIDTTGYDGGQYYMFIKADANGGLTQSNTDNDVSPALALHVVAPGTSPDLTTSNLSVLPAAGDIGTDTMTLSYDVHNIDAANPTTADYWFDALWLSRTPTFDRATAIWANTLFDNPPVLAPGGVYTNTATVPFPTNVGLGTFYVFIETDAFNYQQETNGNNNVTTQDNVIVNLHGADFTTTTVSVDNGGGDPNNTDITVGGSFQVNWHVDNNGDIATPSDWIDAVYVSSLWYLDQTAVKIGQFSAKDMGVAGAVAAGGGYDAGGTVTIPAWLGKGDMNIFVVSGLQSTGGGDGKSITYQPDANIYNNTSNSVQVHLRQPDLSVTAAAVDFPVINAGDSDFVTWSVANNGDAGVAAGWVDRIYISAFSTFSVQTSVLLYTFTSNFSMGGSGNSYGTGVPIYTDGLDGGTYYIFVVTDAEQTVAESDESNNISAAIPLTLTPPPGLPDLIASIDSVVPAPAVGDIGVSSVDVNYRIKNIAPSATNGAAWSDAVWLSPTATFNPATAIWLGSFANDAPILLTNQSYTGQATVFLPADIGIGKFYLFVQADSDNTEVESNGGNNVSPAAGAVPVQLNGPNLAVAGISFDNFTHDPNNHQVTLNDLFELDWTVKNQGNTDSASGWVDGIYVSDSPVWDAASALLVTQFDALDPLPLSPSDSYKAVQQVSLPGWVGAGLHFLYVVTGIEPGGGAAAAAKPFVDSGSSIIFVLDASFANNVSAPIRVNVLVPNVDLTVAIDNAPVTVTAGGYVSDSVDWTVTNNGNDTANGNSNSSANQNWTDTLYMTQTPDDPASYVFLDSYDTAFSGDTPLFGQSSYSASLSGFTIPGFITPGTWYFVLVTDSNDDQGETNETNNLAVVRVDVPSGSPPVIDGSDADDTLYLRRSADGKVIEAFLNSLTTDVPTWIYGLGESIAFNGLAGSDTLTLDFSNGDPIPSLGVNFDGGDGTDALLIRGTDATTDLTVQAAAISAGGTAAEYANVESVALDGTVDSTVALSSLTLSSALSVVAGKNLVLRLSSLSIVGSGALDLGDNDLILDYAGAAPLAAVRGWLRHGRLGVLPSILSSTPSPVPSEPTALALVDNTLLQLTDWDGQVLTSAADFSQLIIKHTYAGDTNLDGQVTPADYQNVLANMGRASSQWFMGDLNDDGVVSPDDLAAVAANMGAGSFGVFGPPLAATATAAPATATGDQATTGAQQAAKSLATTSGAPAHKFKRKSRPTA